MKLMCQQKKSFKIETAHTNSLVPMSLKYYKSPIINLIILSLISLV